MVHGVKTGAQISEQTTLVNWDAFLIGIMENCINGDAMLNNESSNATVVGRSSDFTKRRFRNKQYFGFPQHSSSFTTEPLHQEKNEFHHIFTLLYRIA
jgi:hypothetical protein